MKEKIHPEYKSTTITCACGEVIHIRATKENIRIEICSKCHPFFTGKQKLVDTAGRVEKFKKKYKKHEKKKEEAKAREQAKAEGQAQEKPEEKETKE